MFKKIKKLFLNILGDIKVYRFPFFMIYDPTTFLIKGYHTRQAINAIQTGCIVLRGYKCYADGFFIPGDFSHSGIYVGDGMMIHGGNPIQYASMETSYWQQHFYCFGRLP